MSIGFEANDLADSQPGQDLWRYTYTLADSTFDLEQGFAIFFDYAVSGTLLNPTPWR